MAGWLAGWLACWHADVADFRKCLGIEASKQASKQGRPVLLLSQILQESNHWKALDEIYTIHMLSHRSDLIISEKFCLFAFCGKMFQNSFLMKFCRNSADILKNVDMHDFPNIFNFPANIEFSIPEFYKEF